MKSRLKLLALLICGLVFVVVAVGLVLPSEIRVERRTRIAAPAERVFAQVDNLERYAAWSPWTTQDPTLKLSYGPARQGPGAWFAWTSEGSSQGRMTIRSSEAPRQIALDFDFGDQGSAKGYWHFDQEGQETWVTWAFVMDAGYNLPMRYTGLAMDSVLGPEMERGFKALAIHCQSASG